jgi:hypothetical protein
MGDRELTRAVETLAKADKVAFGPVGFAAKTLPVTEAFWTVERAAAGDPGTVRPHLDRLLSQATPAGKVYAATLLGKVDPAAGRTAWQRLASEKAEVETFTGCILDRTTMAEYAARHLA